MPAIQRNAPNRRAGRGWQPSPTATILAASAAAAAIYNTYRARQVERRHPPTGKFVTVDGIRLHYIERGHGPPVVLIHGNVVTAVDFELSGVMDRAARRHRVIAFDRPGYGFSDRPHGAMWTPAQQADLLRRAFARLGIERPVVAGHSWGAMVALALALDHPDAVSGLVVLGGYYHATMRADALLVAPAAIPIIGDVLRYTVSPLLGAALLPLNIKVMFSPRPVPDHFSRNFPYGMSVRPGQIRAEGQDGATMVPAALAMQGRYGELRMPVIIMAGTEDRVVGIEHPEQLHDRIPHSVLRLVPGVGHMIHHAVPDQVAEAIETAAEGTAGNRRSASAPGRQNDEQAAPAAAGAAKDLETSTAV